MRSPRSLTRAPLAMLASLCIAATALAAPEIPGAQPKGPVALVGAVIHPVSGPAITGGVLLVDDGKIVALGADVDLPEDVERVDVAERHVYPGLIDPYTELGLIEIEAVRATNDRAETGRINPNARAQVAVNPDSELIPVARAGGVLVALTVPSGGLISGRSALMQLDGWTWEDMTVKADVGMHVQWPRMTPVDTWWVEDSAQQQIDRRDRSLDEIRQAFADARAYQKARAAGSDGGQPSAAFDIRWEAMLPVLNKELPLVVDADTMREIQAAVAFAEQEDVRLVIFGGYDAPQCAELLKRAEASVIIGGVYRLPQRRHEDYDAPFRVAARLHAAGVKFCISGRERPGNVRNLPYHAATAVAHGLPAEEALKAVTLYPAEILGVADRLGSLEVGKDATLIVTTGDPLEITTQLVGAYIQGREVDLNNRHKRLWNKYQEKYRRQAAPAP